MNNQSAENFIYKNARPLDIARWNYLFENGDKESVLKALQVYQNEDGGFGHALEPDSWNPNSAPIHTWVAMEILKEIHMEDKRHPIIRGILKYLASGKEFDGHTWANSVESNNAYPHAPWWDYAKTQETSYNPTACFAGFILKFSEPESELYRLAERLAEEAYLYFKNQFPMESMHTVSCFVELYDYLKECAEKRDGSLVLSNRLSEGVSNSDTVLDMEEFKKLLSQQIKHVLTYDTSTWEVDYVCKPSLFIADRNSDFYQKNQELCKYECEFIKKTQQADGTWAITWDWGSYPEEWSISKNWWKSDVIIKNLKFMQAMQ